MAESSAVRPAAGERVKSLMAQYGRLALWIYFAIFALVFAGFAVAIGAGLEVEGATQSAGTLAAAYMATKLTQPVRIAATLALTPVVAAVARRLRGSAEAPRSQPASAEEQ